MVLKNIVTIGGIGDLPLQFSETPSLALFYVSSEPTTFAGPPAGVVFPYAHLCPCLHRIRPARAPSSPYVISFSLV